MRLLLEEIVEHPDADHVLRTLEYFLREVSLETVLSGDELTVYGLGPSFRTMNRRDTTIVRATPQFSATRLHAEANFLASALAGNAAQDEIVRSKLERAFESLKARLNHGAASDQKVTKTSVIVEQAAPSPVTEIALPTAAASTATVVEAEKISPAPIESAPVLTPTPQKERQQKPETKAELEPELKIEAKVEPRVEPNPAPKVEEPVPAAAGRSVPVPFAAMMEEAPVRKRQSAILLVLPLLLLVLAVGFYLLQHHGAPRGGFSAHAEEHTASAAIESKAVAPASAPTPVQPTPATMPTDVKAWVQAWAAAISTRDVQAQLAFYATPLDRYFLTPDVSREQLLKDKQAEINDRKGVWTLKAENVVVQKTPTNAVVYFDKHITVKLPSSAIREERLKAQLKLKMVDGKWKITSERTIG